jgi:beta-glucosidase
MGGWENEKVADVFVPYVQKTVDALKDYVNYWITINEPNLLAAYAYVLGNFPPGKKDLGTALKVMTNLVGAHAAAYQAIHKIQPTARVSIALNYRSLQPARGWSPLDLMTYGLYNSFFNDFFPRAFTTGVLRLSGWRKNIPQAKGTLDYLGLNYYTRELVAFTPHRDQAFGRRFFPPGAELSDSGQIANVPQGLFDMLRWARHFNLPIVITENGLDDAGDTLRPRYLIQHLHQLWRMVNENNPVKGYFHWTLVDNFEWERGWTQRFGLWELDVETQARRKRPSADLYAEICAENGVTSDMVSRYTPELSDLLFPG